MANAILNFNFDYWHSSLSGIANTNRQAKSQKNMGVNTADFPKTAILTGAFDTLALHKQPFHVCDHTLIFFHRIWPRLKHSSCESRISVSNLFLYCQGRRRFFWGNNQIDCFDNSPVKCMIIYTQTKIIAIGGNMGLFTGFSILTLFEFIFYALRSTLYKWLTSPTTLYIIFITQRLN